MANYEVNQLLTVVKSYARSNPLAIDASSVWESQAEAEIYAKEANAYGGQIITAKVNGEYKAFILQGENGNCTIKPFGVDESQLKQYVVIGTRPVESQEQGVIYIENNIGYIWTGTEWKKIFEDVSASIADFEKRIGKLETDISTKANIANPNFTGVARVEGKELATKEYADAIVAAAKAEVPIVIDDSNPFPAQAYKAGQKYVVAKPGTYLGQKCEVGDVILITKDYAEGSAANTDGIVLQANIDGAVTGAESSVDGEIVVFSGATGKVIKSSKINMTALNDAISKAHEHANKAILDSYDMTQSQLLETASTDAQNKVNELKTIVDGKADKSTTLTGYGITDAYNKTEIEAKLKTITDNVNTKVDASTVDSKIQTAIDTKVGDLGSSATVREYVDKVVGSGGADVATQIDAALQTAKAYTDEQISSALAVVTF
nr:hypothetical protein [uncultured Blautia sp.]